MSKVDIAIVGGGLAGSTAAAMLGRAGIRTAIVDPHDVYPPDFRCEKLDASQIALLQKTGLADAVLPAGTIDDEATIARFGRLVGVRRHHQFGILYDTLVNTVRAAIPGTVERITSKAVSVSLSSDRQRIALSNGGEIDARLVIMANGLNTGLREALGMSRAIVSPTHSISIGFDVKPVGRPRFGFRSLTYGPERIADRVAYLTLFPVTSGMRANLFVYRDMRDPWLSDMRHAPSETLAALFPGLSKLTGDFEVSSFVQIRPVDLYVATGLEQPGIVLVGDAFGTSCPAAGTGVNKVFTDVERLCNVHVPAWLATEGMGTEKINTFYGDAVKVASDRYSAEKAMRLRSLSTESGLVWRARRWARVVGLYGICALQDLRARMPVGRSGGGPGSSPLGGFRSRKVNLGARFNLAHARIPRTHQQRDSNV